VELGHVVEKVRAWCKVLQTDESQVVDSRQVEQTVVGWDASADRVDAHCFLGTGSTACEESLRVEWGRLPQNLEVQSL